MLDKIKAKLWKEHIVLPAVHAKTTAQVIENLKIIQWEWADWFFLVNNKVSSVKLREIYQDIQGQFEDLFHGINDLGLDPEDKFTKSNECRVDWIWVDNPRIPEINKIDCVSRIENAKQVTKWDWLYFWWVAFKYQLPLSWEELPIAIQAAKKNMDVITTSGTATWSAAMIDDVKYMKILAWDFPIALASWITPENIASYLPYVDVSIVATGISKDFFNFDNKKLRELIRKIK